VGVGGVPIRTTEEKAGGHTRLRKRGWWVPKSDEGTDTVVLYRYICTL